MQKKLPLVLSVMLFSNLANCANTPAVMDFGALGKVASLVGVCGLLGVGQYAGKMNKEYAQKGKKPDAKMALVKVCSAASLLVGGDILLFGTNDTAENLVKIGAFTVAVFAGSDSVANAVQWLPCIGDILTGPIKEDGTEDKDVGAAARILLTYIPLRNAGIGLLKGSKLPESSGLQMKE